MRTVLVVSPHFPPLNAADMHRVRISLGYFRSFGWNPVVLTVAPQYVECINEPLLTKTLSDDISVFRVPALPARLTRKFGLGNLGLRAFPFLYKTGCRLIRRYAVDLVYFSTTVFPVMALGRLWKRKFHLPFVVDMQDPWVTDYYEKHPHSSKPPKYWVAARMHRLLEPWTMPDAGGLIAVSRDYIDTLKRRYPALAEVPAVVLPFGAAQSDFDIVRKNPGSNKFFQRCKNLFHGVYLGRAGSDMGAALQIIFVALKIGLQEKTDLFSRVRLHFVGTDYAPSDRARKTVEPVAEALGVAPYVEEHPSRIPYFEGLQLLEHADFLIVPGSDDAQYTASKIFPYILARKPLLAVFNEKSSVCEILRTTRSGSLLAFQPLLNSLDYSNEFYRMWADTLSRLPFEPETDWDCFNPYTARATAQKQAELFDKVLNDVSAISHSQ